MIQTDVLIIGCGIAGRDGGAAAGRATRSGASPSSPASRDPHESNTRYAQGGIIARGPDDSAELAGRRHPGRRRRAPAHRKRRASWPKKGPPLLRRDPGRRRPASIRPRAGRRSGLGPGGGPLAPAHPARGRRHRRRPSCSGLIAALRRCPNVTFVTNATAVDLITFPHHSRDPLAAYQPITCHGAYVFDRESAHGPPLPGRGDRPGDRRAGPHLPQHHQPARRARRWAGDGPPRRRAHHQRRVRPVPSHGAGRARRRGLPDQRGGARRGRRSCSRPTGARSWRSTRPSGRTWPRATWWRAPSITEMETHGYSHVLLDIASHMAAGRHPRPLPQHLRQVPGGRHRHHPRADPGGAGRALLLRRRVGGRVGPLQHREPVRRRRGQLHRAARRQPAGVHLAAGRVWSGATAPPSTSRTG